MPFPYRKTLIIGATAGIGEAFAERLVDSQQVIIVGRREERLAASVEKYGTDKAVSVPFDITKLDQIPEFVAGITQSHPDLDCVFLNAGIQRKFDFSKPNTVDMDVIIVEFTTNYLACVALTKAFLPFLMGKDHETALIYISSGLALVPIPAVVNYSASKAALHHFVLSVREQLKSSKVKVIEVYPPAVQTELHDEIPGVKKGPPIGMPLGDFMDEAWAGLIAGREDIPISIIKNHFETFENARVGTFRKMLAAAPPKKEQER